MVEPDNKAVLKLLERPGNDECADCASKNPEWASYNIGIFLCTRCADVHKWMGARVSKVKHLRLGRWEDSQIQRLRDTGNNAAKLKYQQRVPPCYRIPVDGDPHSLVEQWICAKYLREEFCRAERQGFMTGHMEGFLMKRGKEDPEYYPRRFALSESEDTLKYYVKENREPKAVLKVSEMSVIFAPEKMEMRNSLQMSYQKDWLTRHIYVYHDDAQTIVNWYNAIRCAKLHNLQVAFPSASQAELVNMLTNDFTHEGWLWKTGPKPTDAYKKRWFTLDRRKLMYHVEPLAAHPKGEIFIGHMLEGYSVRVGVPPGTRDQGYSFTLRTPDRCYNLTADTPSARDVWINRIASVLELPTTPQDIALAARLSKKRTGGSGLNIFSSR